MSSQRSNITPTVQNMNNHSLLRRNGVLSSTTLRLRDPRASSPSRPTGSGAGRLSQRDPRSPTPERDDFTTEPVTSRALSLEELNLFNTLAMDAGLDPASKQRAQKHAEVYGSVHQHIALAVVHAKTQFEVSNLSQKMDRLTEKLDDLLTTVSAQTAALSPATGVNAPGSVPWVCSQELHSYTALEMDHVWLPQSLFISIKNLNRYKHLTFSIILFSSSLVALYHPLLYFDFKHQINQQAADWLAEHLPHHDNGVQDGAGTRAYNTCIRNACKHAREKLHNLLLTGIYDAKTGDVVDKPVPSLKSLWHRIANRFAIAGAHADSNSLWAATDSATRARMAYLRREAVRIFQIGRGSSSIWACADAQLNKMRVKGDDYTAAFLKYVYDQDVEAFNFKNYFEELKVNCDFKLPSDDEVDAIIADE
ncbi:uncharacterized protein MELLADRAFT_68711 [Melampsora larici-populina 98AG31]|uniref:Uncharacterized protein n=1 Tax=Melampsora larici-populina (strain 98AG31 / pathotype 3-4-7) TaxID=747676 RepID=F4S7X1_MELLP|nr:uncharacterized protein MELLADRAFT_68711 [Melampsora larici-populina 98AG31]EGF99286.1 hypothetical protein MELLADRAFT_68711 [Melampsora larici-populina 98AG31]